MLYSKISLLKVILLLRHIKQAFLIHMYQQKNLLCNKKFFILSEILCCCYGSQEIYDVENKSRRVKYNLLFDMNYKTWLLSGMDLELSV